VLAVRSRRVMQRIEVIPSSFYWLELDAARHSLVLPTDTATEHYFSIDEDPEYVYDAVSYDFGPLPLDKVYRYCQLVESMLREGRSVIHCCSSDPQKRANAAMLVCAYQVVVRHVPAEAAFLPFRRVALPFLPFRDSDPDIMSMFDLTIMDCLQGLELAIKHGWFNWTDADLEDYEFYASEGDMNWVIPKKLLAFSRPSQEQEDVPAVCFRFPDWTPFAVCFSPLAVLPLLEGKGEEAEDVEGSFRSCLIRSPEDYAEAFKKLDIGLVVRLNRATYDKTCFTDQGINHMDLYFEDGSCPSEEIISKFLAAVERQPGPVAVHCKAGLGRTGTLIGLYAMKHYNFPARAFIGWSRLCRPGSVMGEQQEFLVNMEKRMHRRGIEGVVVGNFEGALDGGL